MKILLNFLTEEEPDWEQKILYGERNRSDKQQRGKSEWGMLYEVVYCYKKRGQVKYEYKYINIDICKYNINVVFFFNLWEFC